MKHLRKTLQYIHDDVISREFDRLVLIIGDEGMGKSTLMLSLMLHWDDIRGKEQDQDDIFDRMVWDGREAFTRTIVEKDAKSAISVMDAARVLHRRQSMHGDQVELQQDLLDSRFKEQLIFLGFQSWDDIPTFLQKRRAKNAIVIPRRGYVRAYNREDIDRKFETGDWPDPRFRDGFPSLEGTDLWDEFQARDEEHKRDRMVSEESLSVKEVKRLEQAKIAIQLHKPWDGSGGMTLREAAKYTDFSRTWVSSRVQEWKEGEIEVDLTDHKSESKQGAGVS
jgi:hypothetical protein